MTLFFSTSDARRGFEGCVAAAALAAQGLMVCGSASSFMEAERISGCTHGQLDDS